MSLAAKTLKTKQKPRLTAEERHDAILAAALPLFADIGFRGTTTKMLAQHAGISEALLYQHFPSKDALYTEVQDYLCRHHPALEKLLNPRPASTEALVYFIYMISQLLLDPPLVFDVGQVIPRIMLQSILDDGAFVRLHLERNLQPMIKAAAGAISAARRAGDILESDGMSDDLRFLFAHHIIVMVHLGSLPAIPLFDYPTSKDQMIDYVVRFALRGMGMTDAAVAKSSYCCNRSMNQIQSGDDSPHSKAKGETGVEQFGSALVSPLSVLEQRSAEV
jgi:AcrR family transcriptional regulator